MQSNSWFWYLKRNLWSMIKWNWIQAGKSVPWTVKIDCWGCLNHKKIFIKKSIYFKNYSIKSAPLVSLLILSEEKVNGLAFKNHKHPNFSWDLNLWATTDRFWSTKPPLFGKRGSCVPSGAWYYLMLYGSRNFNLKIFNTKIYI